MSEELKPCPFCGKAPLNNLDLPPELAAPRSIQCVTEWCGYFGVRSVSIREAVRIWNNRAPSPAVAAKPRMFPLQTCKNAPPGPVSIPWAVAEVAYGAYAAEFGRQQTLERLAERAGFSWWEMDHYHPKWREEVSAVAALEAERDKLRARVAELEREVELLRDTASTEARLACAWARKLPDDHWMIRDGIVIGLRSLIALAPRAEVKP